MATEEALPPHLFVVFGGTGDLARRKLLPALYRLMNGGELADKSVVLGVARDTRLDDDAFRDLARESLREAGLPADEIAAWCGQRLHYQAVGSGTAEDYKALGERIAALEQEHELPGNRAFYLALPPEAFAPTLTGLGEVGLNRAPGWARLVIEKPFGRDLASARELNGLLHRYFEESQVYRIDHYLGKETVQNLLVFRFANPIFETLWNRDRIRSVEITVAEELGVEERARYYDKAGVLRDMIQNHLTQLLTLVAMEVPTSFSAEAIRQEKLKVLQAVAAISPKDVVLGQYGAGEIADKQVPGYQQEADVAPGSKTPTYAALPLRIANWRWEGVPFVLQTGKRLPRRRSRITIAFDVAPVSFFRSLEACTISSNALVISIQPDEGFDLYFEVKDPGHPGGVRTERLDFRYQEAFGPLREAYETLLVDVVAGDQTLFVHADEVEASWRLYTPLLDQADAPQPYPAGSWGPEAARQVVPEPQRVLASEGGC